MSEAITARNAHQVINDAVIYVSQRNMLRHVYDDALSVDAKFTNIKEDSEVTKEDLEELLELALTVGLELAIEEKYNEMYKY